MDKKKPIPLSAVWNDLDQLSLHDHTTETGVSRDNVGAAPSLVSSSLRSSSKQSNPRCLSSNEHTVRQQPSTSFRGKKPAPVSHRDRGNRHHSSKDPQFFNPGTSTAHTNSRDRTQNDKDQNRNHFNNRRGGNTQNEVSRNGRHFYDNGRNRYQRKVISEEKHNYFSGQFETARPISFTTLKELVTTKTPNEILLTINKKNCGFMCLVKQDDMRPDMVALALIALGKACTSILNHSVCSLLNTVCNNNTFLLISIQKYLVSLRQNSLKDFHLESLSYLTSFLQKFQHTLPSSSSEPISMLLPLVRLQCENFLKNQIWYDDVITKLAEIQAENEHYIKEHSPSEIKKGSEKEKLQACEPPESFRSLPVLPTIDDMHSNAFLRPNIVEGKYMDTEQYLDIQYRLLREDYVRPLRDGIADYSMLKRTHKSLKNCRDIRVYENVHIMKQDFVNGKIVYIVHFADKNFSKIRWEYSKRLLSGSLLCLSSDNFQTMLFASVARRLPEELKKGLLLVQFEEFSDEVLNLTPLTRFDVIETTAYFEAYRHNLKALHELSEKNLPLQRYIVQVEKVVNNPEYLNPSTTYDFRPLLLPIDDKHIKRIVNTKNEVSIQYDFPDDIAQVCQSVHVLNDGEWPSHSALGLDHSQYLALKAAVTKEFALIQGPPGTGKTFVGVRIGQLLLHNIDRWFTRQTNSLPILVVCFTNHALDQFLEGLMRFTEKIVRIGGRSSNEAVARFQLSNLKKNALAKKEIPRYIASSMWQKNHELRQLKLELDIINKFIQNSTSIVYGERHLKNVIPQIHLISLKSILRHPSVKEYNLSDDGLLIHDWLGIRSRGGWGDPGMFSTESTTVQHTTNNIFVPDVVNEVDECDDNLSTGEADIEFIEAQRDIDSEEFAGVSFEIEAPEMEEEFNLPHDAGWHVQGGQKQRKRYIKRNLYGSQPLEENKAMKIRNVWDLHLAERWQLYKFWLQKLIEEKQQDAFAKQLILKERYKEVCEMRTEGDIFILQNAHIVGMTTTGAAKYRDIVVRLNPQILIVEEAAEILESHTVTSLAPQTQHVILIGDHQQLRPSPTVHVLAVKYDLNVSLFERMIKNQMDCFRLSIQHRMRPEVAALIVPHIYKNLENHKTVTEYENVKGVGKNVFFITHSYNELQESDSKSKINEHEANFLVKLCKYFVLQGYDPSQITVLTTYSGQLFAMKKLVTDAIRKVKFTVVDNFQGEENDIILISFVRSNEEGEIGFLKVANRVCVALSRAKKGLFCIGNFELLAEKSDLWKNINKTLEGMQAIGPSLQLMCQNHEGVSNVVASEKDFESVPEGGCTRPCEYRLTCGHTCSLMCHPYDREHENIHCYKQCTKTCEFGHQCKRKCFENCGSCTTSIEKYIDSCGHTVKIQCCKQNEPTMCTAKCDKLLPCGHNCSNICSEICSVFCEKMITITSPICGHVVSIQCCYKTRTEMLLESCRSPCSSVLDCSHTCKGNCYSCKQGRLHVRCNQLCKRILVCGHECKAPCAKSCPPCKVPCENRCIHSRCPKKCGEPCKPCTEKCEWHCKHQQCLQKCGELCNRIPCNVPCLESLPCGHPCIGFCGEPCPSQCRDCDSATVKEIFFGTEEDDNARFVLLEDCKHIVEITGLKTWLNTEKSNHQIQMKTCPKCKTVIRTNLRFGNAVKECLKKIENVKKKTFGNEDDNKERLGILLNYLEINLSVLNVLKSGSIYKTWVKTVTSKRCRNIQEITTMENMFHVSSDLATAVQYFGSCNSHLNADLSVRKGLEVICIFMNFSKHWLIDFVEDEYLNASEQQLTQLTWEVHRLDLAMKFMKTMKDRVLKSSDTEFEKCVSVLTKYSPFGENDVQEFASAYQKLCERCGQAVINISECEKKSILKAMNLSLGHWYQCPNGHVYCITECGGAMEQGRCNECNETIGGRNHALLSTNRVAREMDGAAHAAWSDAMNMGNYHIGLEDDDRV